ncbi:unnamed protein product [Pleuronectes platessa]|uniref:Helicase C-terminal domain-containing protein n=1 Tax=Pleuronectes platessa TaxID=8262 RepID=A0A9N7UYG9_PLEPL|nr:unnamed protein product [Pleuronectes platessa]
MGKVDWCDGFTHLCHSDERHGPCPPASLPCDGAAKRLWVGAILGSFVAWGSAMSRARLLNDTLIQHILSSFAAGSGSGHSHHSVIAGQQCTAGAVKDYIKMMLEAEELKFLVFAHHLTMLQACTEAVIEAKAGYIRIDGSVPSSERVKLVHKFQSDPQTRVAVLSIQAAGQGLTLTAASHVVFAELYWNPGHIKQAEDRAHRIGQTASVNVHYLIAKGTFDTVMWSMLNKKETVTGSTLNGRKEYLKADEGDKDKWEFLNFADAWTPSETVLPPLEGNPGDGKDELFFSHFERDKQHDIRAFFSPSTEKKRKRTGDEETSPSISAETTDAPAGSSTSSEKRREKSQAAPHLTGTSPHS